jgi:hypothetical protein
MKKELYTASTLYTLAGASVAVTVVCGALGNALHFNPKWFALFVAQAIAFTGARSIPEKDRQNAFWLLAFVNGCLIYCQAVGMNTLNVAQPSIKGANSQTLVPVVGKELWWPSADQKEASKNMVETANTSSKSVATTVSQLRRIDLTAKDWQAKLESHLEEVTHNREATEKGLASSTNDSERESLQKSLPALKLDEQKTNANLANVLVFERMLDDPNGEITASFRRMGDSLDSSQQALKDATKDLSLAFPQLKSLP